MVRLLNRYSYLPIVAIVTAIAYLLGSQLGGGRAALTALGALAVLIVIWQGLKGNSSVVTWQEAADRIGQGQPVLLFLYANT